MKILCKIFGHKWKFAGTPGYEKDGTKTFFYKCTRCKEIDKKIIYSSLSLVNKQRIEMSKDSIFKIMLKDQKVEG